MILFRTTAIRGGIEKKTPWEQSSRGKKDWSGMVQRSDSEPQANNPVKYTDPDGRITKIEILEVKWKYLIYILII